MLLQPLTPVKRHEPTWIHTSALLVEEARVIGGSCVFVVSVAVQPNRSQLAWAGARSSGRSASARKHPPVGVVTPWGLGDLEIMHLLLTLLFATLVTVPIAAMICRIRIARTKRISYGTLLMSACALPFALVLYVTCFEPGIWLSLHGKVTPDYFLMMLGYLAAYCVLPSLGVAVYYQRRTKM